MISHKIIFLGDADVGKTSLINRIKTNLFYKYQENTIGMTYHELYYKQYGIKLEIWDTAGQERYRSITSLYYRGASIAIVVFDVSDKDSFKKAESWIKELAITSPDVMVVLVGNKCDLSHIILLQDGLEMATKYNAVYYETSAKTNAGVQTLLLDILQTLQTMPPKIKYNLLEKPMQKSNCPCLIL